LIKHDADALGRREPGPVTWVNCTASTVLGALRMGFVLDQFFSASMEHSNMRIDTLDKLAIKFQNEA
jgi:hypothetical protein